MNEDVPLTFAHPAAVLPLRRVLWVPGLVAGSLAPDVAYYLPVHESLRSTHSLTSLFTVDLLWAAVLLILWRVALAPVLALSPAGLRGRVEPPGPMPRDVRGGLTAIGSVITGAASHLVWDSFTHTGGPAVTHWPLLRSVVIGPHRVYNVIGYVSSVAGLLILLVLALRWWRRTPTEHSGRWPTLTTAVRGWIFAGVVAGAIVGALIGLTDPVAQVSEYDRVRQLIIGATQGAVLSVALHVIVWLRLDQHGYRRRRQPDRPDVGRP